MHLITWILHVDQTQSGKLSFVYMLFVSLTVWTALNFLKISGSISVIYFILNHILHHMQYEIIIV